MVSARVKAKAIAVICVVGRREWVRSDATRARELWELLQSSSGEGLSEKRGNINIKHSRYGSGVVGGSVEHVQLLALRMVGGSRGIRPSWELMQVLEGEGQQQLHVWRLIRPHVRLCACPPPS